MGGASPHSDGVHEALLGKGIHCTDYRSCELSLNSEIFRPLLPPLPCIPTGKPRSIPAGQPIPVKRPPRLGSALYGAGGTREPKAMARPPRRPPRGSPVLDAAWLAWLAWPG